MVEGLLIALIVLIAVTLLLSISVLFGLRRVTAAKPVSRDDLYQLLRNEADLIRRAGDDQARNLRQELTDHLKGLQDSIVTTVGVLSEGVRAQISNFGEQLDGDVKSIDVRVSGLGEKLDLDLRGMGESAQVNREALRTLIEGKLESSATRQAENFKDLREELGHNFQHVRGTLTSTLGEMGDRQKERLDTAKNTIDGLSEKLDTDIAQMGEAAERSRETLRNLIEGKLDAAATKQAEEAKSMREELGQSFHTLGGKISVTLGEMSGQQKERLDKTALALESLSEKNERSGEALRRTVEERLDAIRLESASKLDEMRQTVDEKLHSTLETRLGESFNRVVEHLARVHEGLGEMKSLASNVGDLRSVLTNVKVRGTFGEVQLEMLLEQFLTPDQYIKNAQVRDGSGERVEFAVRFPGKGAGAEVLLPIDAKFPRETFDRLLEASQAGDEEQVRACRKQLENQIRSFAKDIGTKYINTPKTTDFAILFLPTEGLYAEMLRQVGIFEFLQREYKVTLAGPTTLSAILNAFQMGFRSLAIEKRSGEVWQILGAVQAEFKKYNEVVDKLGNQLSTAARSVESLGTRTKAMNRKLRSVQSLPDGTMTAALLGLEGEDAAAAEDGLVVALHETKTSIVVATGTAVAVGREQIEHGD